MNEQQEMAEKVESWFRTVAFSENPDISNGSGAIYQTCQRLFKAAIRAAYPLVDENDIFDVWVDCNESVAYCAEYVQNNPESNVYTTPR